MPASSLAPPRERSDRREWRALLAPGMLLLHVAAVLAVAAAGWLGWWQVGAWQAHREARAANLVDEPAVPLEDVIGADDPFPADGVGRPVKLRGTWLPDDTVTVTGRTHEGRAGAWVVTPVATCGTATGCPAPAALPVVVGWTPDAVPEAPRGAVELTGWLQPGESGDVDPDPTDDVLPALRIPDLVQRLDTDAYGGYLLLDEPADLRAGRDLEAVHPDALPDPPASTGLRNLLYGIEWWVFGGFAVFLWSRWCRDAIHPRAPAEAVDAPLPSGP